MADITNPKLICAKGFLFLGCGTLAATVLILENPTVKTAALVALVAWCFARFYYFAFYVIEHYVDSSYRFSGLWSFVRYFYMRKRFRQGTGRPPKDPSRDP
jgi:hypothetical protein